MPYTPYTLQTILSSPPRKLDEPPPIQASTSTSFFSRRPTSPTTSSNEAGTGAGKVTSPTIRYAIASTTRIDSVGAWGKYLEGSDFGKNGQHSNLFFI